MKYRSFAITLSLSLLALLPLRALAGCDTQQTLCDARCSIIHFDDKAAKAGCESRCLAERAACSTKQGAHQAVELGKKALNDTSSFLKGLTEDKQ